MWWDTTAHLLEWLKQNFLVLVLGVYGEFGHSLCSCSPTGEPLGQRNLSSALCFMSLGDGWYGYIETFLSTLFNASFFVLVLHPGAVISHLDSRALVKIFLSMDNCQINVSVGIQDGISYSTILLMSFSHLLLLVIFSHESWDFHDSIYAK